MVPAPTSATHTWSPCFLAASSCCPLRAPGWFQDRSWKASSCCGHWSLCLGEGHRFWAVTEVSCKKLENTAPEFTCLGGVCWESLKASGRHLSGGCTHCLSHSCALVSSALGLQDLGLLLQVSLGVWGWFWKDELGQPLIADR